MKKRFKLIIIVGIFSITVPQIISAQSDSTASDADIRRECYASQQYVRTTLKERDLRARVDRLQVYQYSLKRLDLFTQRLQKHGQPYADEFKVATTELEKNINNFKNNYEVYDSAREHLTKLGDCSNNINEFKSRLKLAREKLAIVQSDITKISSLLDNEVKKLLKTLEKELASSQLKEVTNE